MKVMTIASLIAFAAIALPAGAQATPNAKPTAKPKGAVHCKTRKQRNCINPAGKFITP